MSFSSQGNFSFDSLADESSVPDTPMSHLMFYFYCVDKLTNLSENNAQLKRVIDYKNDNLTPDELEVLLVFCTQLDPDSLDGKCLVKNDELCGDKNFKILKIEELPEGAVKSEDFFIAGQRVKCDRVIAYKKSWIKSHFYEPWMKVVVPDKQALQNKNKNKENNNNNNNNEDNNRILLPAASPRDSNNNGGKVVIVKGSKVSVEEIDKAKIKDLHNNNNNNNVNSNNIPLLSQQSPHKEEVKPLFNEIKPIITYDNNNNNNVEKPPLRVKSTPIPPSNDSNLTHITEDIGNNNNNIANNYINGSKPISKHYTIPSNNPMKPLVVVGMPQPVYPRPNPHTTKVNTNSNDVHIIINPAPNQQNKQQQQNNNNNKPSQSQQQHINKSKNVVYKYVWCCFVEVSKCSSCCIDCVRNLLTFAVLLVFIAFLGMKFTNYLDYNSSLLQKYAIIAMFCSLSLSFEIIELCINCLTIKKLNYMGYRLYSIFIAIYYVLICIYTGIADSSLPFYCFTIMAIIHLFGSCWKVKKED